MTAKSRFDSALALHDEDLAPLIISWGFALSVAAAWLAVVHLTVLPVAESVGQPTPTVIDFAPDRSDNPTPSSSTSLPTVDQRQKSRPTHSVASEVAVAGIFAAAMAKQAVSEVTHLIPGVVAIRGETRADARKRALSTEADVRPGMSSFAAIGSGEQPANVGDVKRGGGIDRANSVRISYPS